MFTRPSIPSTRFLSHCSLLPVRICSSFSSSSKASSRSLIRVASLTSSIIHQSNQSSHYSSLAPIRRNRMSSTHSNNCSGCGACTTLASSNAAPASPQTGIHSSATLLSPTNAASSAAVSASRSAIHPTEPSAFLRGRQSPKKNSPTAANTYSPSVKGPLPSHIHSATCGCSGKIEALDGDNHHLIEGHIAVDKSPSKWNVAAMLEHNHRFVEGKQYEPLLTDRFPFKKLVIVSCMDTRLTQLLPLALDLKNGDAKIIKVAGAMVAHPFGSVMRSILVAVYGLGAEHILVVGHHDCGMTGMDPKKILDQAQARGIPESTFKTLQAAGLNLNSWLSGFDSVESSVLASCDTIRNHPLLSFSADAPKKLTITGMVICPTTGKLDLVTPPDEATEKFLSTQKESEEAKTN